MKWIRALIRMSRPKLDETQKFGGSQDQDSRLKNLEDVETDTHLNLKIWRMSRLGPIKTQQKVSRPRVLLLNVEHSRNTILSILESFLKYL